MAEYDRPPPKSSAKHGAPMIALPSRSSVESLFTGRARASPGPMSLVSSFFAYNDPNNDFRSFSQLLVCAISSTAGLSDVGHGFVRPAAESKRGVGGVGEFRFHLNRPGGLAVSQPPGMFTIPAGLSPSSLLDSPGIFDSSQQQFLAQLAAQPQMQIQLEYPSLVVPSSSLQQLQSHPFSSSLQQNVPPVADSNRNIESSEVSYSDHRSHPANVVVDKPADDGYNWQKYGQKQVKGSDYPRSYYKCTHPSCPVKKKVERSLDGHITEIIYKGQHNHAPPSKRAKDMDMGSEGQIRSQYKPDEGVPESSQVSLTHEHISASSDSEEVGGVETRVNARNEDEPESKRSLALFLKRLHLAIDGSAFSDLTVHIGRNVDIHTSEQASSHRTVTEPRIIVQTTSEIDILDDGYRWRKHGRKVVKGNPYPRSYYKCTTPGCNVRKHVERAPSDPKAVITTYERKHNHNVPAAKNSSHSNTNAPSHLGLNNPVVDWQMESRRMESRNKNDLRPVALLQFKDEQIT